MGVLNRYGFHRRLTGAQAAEAVLRANGVYNVTITSTWGKLTDHYDPRDNTIYLSQAVYSTATVAAVGVAARTSATRSRMERSISCPTAETTGTGQL